LELHSAAIPRTTTVNCQKHLIPYIFLAPSLLWKLS